MAERFDDGLGDVSGGGGIDGGGGTGGGGTSAEALLTELVTDEGGQLAVAYGEHLIAGHLIAHKYAAGPPPASTVIVAGGEGEWDSVVAAWYAGEPLSSSPDGTTAGYHFHRGTISTGIADAVQGVDSFLSAGLAYSGAAYLAVKLPEIFAVEDRPDKLRWRAKCKKVWDYDANGTPTTFTYSTNPARVAADRVRRHFEQRYLNAADALDRFQHRIDWPSWFAWKNYCDTLITWNDGTTSNRQIKRFECLVVFTADVTLADALDLITASAASFWQDDGEQLHFLTPELRDPVHHLHPGNLVSGTLTVSPLDLRARPNVLVGKFRNLDDPFLTEASVEVKRTTLINQVGRAVSERRLPNMTFSQAQRLLERQLRIETDNPVIVTLRAMADGAHVLPGDFVTVSHPMPGWEYQRCLVIEAALDSGEQTADEVELTLQKINDVLYLDTDHSPVQPALTP